MSVLYCLVARAKDKAVLVEHTDCEGNVQVVAREILQDLKISGFHTMKGDDRYLFSYLLEEKLVFLCMCSKQETAAINKFLTRVRREFEDRYSAEDSEKKAAGFLPKLKALMKESASGSSKLDEVDVELGKLEADMIESRSSLSLTRKAARPRRRAAAAGPESRPDGAAREPAAPRRSPEQKRPLVAQGQVLPHRRRRPGRLP